MSRQRNHDHSAPPWVPRFSVGEIANHFRTGVAQEITEVPTDPESSYSVKSTFTGEETFYYQDQLEKVDTNRRPKRKRSSDDGNTSSPHGNTSSPSTATSTTQTICQEDFLSDVRDTDDDNEDQDPHDAPAGSAVVLRGYDANYPYLHQGGKNASRSTPILALSACNDSLRVFKVEAQYVSKAAAARAVEVSKASFQHSLKGAQVGFKEQPTTMVEGFYWMLDKVFDFPDPPKDLPAKKGKVCLTNFDPDKKRPYIGGRAAQSNKKRPILKLQKIADHNGDDNDTPSFLVVEEFTVRKKLSKAFLEAAINICYLQQ